MRIGAEGAEDGEGDIITGTGTDGAEDGGEDIITGSGTDGAEDGGGDINIGTVMDGAEGGGGDIIMGAEGLRTGADGPEDREGAVMTGGGKVVLIVGAVIVGTVDVSCGADIGAGRGGAAVLTKAVEVTVVVIN